MESNSPKRLEPSPKIAIENSRDSDKPTIPPRYIGIDPGKQGGIVCLTHELVIAQPLSDMTERDLWDWFGEFAVGTGGGKAYAVIERVGGFMGSDSKAPGSPAEAKKHNKASGHTMFTFGQSYGTLRAFLIASRIWFESVEPKTWQTHSRVAPRKKGESKVSFKNRLKARAQEVFPETRVTLAVSDALLLARYCKDLREGKVKR